MKTLNNIPESFNENRLNAVRRLASIKHAHLQSFSAGVNSVDVCKFIVFTLSCKSYDSVTVWAVDHNESLYKESFKRDANGRKFDRYFSTKRENRSEIASYIFCIRQFKRPEVVARLHSEWATATAGHGRKPRNIYAAIKDVLQRAK